MLLRDAVVVGLSALAVVMLLRQDGSLTLRRSFVIPSGGGAAMPLPPRVVRLPNGGLVVMAAQEFSLCMYHPPRGDPAGGAGGGAFAPLTASKCAPLYGRPVGIGIGARTYPSVRRGESTPPTFVAVLTHDLHLSLLDSQFSEQWSTAVVPMASEYASVVPHHASVMVRPERIYEIDEGSVLVVVSVGGANGTEKRLAAAFDGRTGSLRWRREVNVEYAVDGTMNNTALFGGAPTEVVDDGDFASIKEWTAFRESVIKLALPHVHTHPWDDDIVAVRFATRKSRRKHQRSPKGSPPAHKVPHRGSQHDDVGVLGEQWGLSTDSHSAAHKQSPWHDVANAVVLHTARGITVLHYYTGGVVTQVAPLHRHALYTDINDDLIIDELSSFAGIHQNVELRTKYVRFGGQLRALRRTAVAEEHRCDAVVTSGAPFASDVVVNVPVCHPPSLLPSLDALSDTFNRRADDDHGSSGENHVDPLSLVESHSSATEHTRILTPVIVQQRIPLGAGTFRMRRLAVYAENGGLVTAVDVAKRRVAWRSQTESTFADWSSEEEVSMGLHSEEEKDGRIRVYPHLVEYSPHAIHRDARRNHTYTRPLAHPTPFVIVVGDRYLSVLHSISGVVAATAALPEPPIAPLIISDFDGGAQDVLLTTEGGVYGFRVSIHAGGTMVSTTIMLALGLLAALVAVQQVAARQYGESSTSSSVAAFPPRPRVKRSTD